VHPQTNLERLLKEVQEAFEAMQGVINAVAKVAGALKDYFSKETVEWIHKQLERFKRLVERLSKKVYHALEMIGDPGYLQTVADVWSKTVAKSAEKMRGDSEGGIAVHWSGEAARAYLVAEKTQRSALDSLKGHADGIAEYLEEAAEAIDDFHKGLVMAFAACGVAMFVEGGQILTVIGAPLGMSEAAVSLAGLVIVFTGLLAKLEYDLGKTNKKIAAEDLDKWPAATSSGDVSDGSVCDGDQSGWKFNGT